MGDGGQQMSAISMYRQLKQAADNDPARSLDTYAKAALSDNLRAHITVTDDPSLLNLTGFYAHRINPMTAADALGVVGLFLRKDDPFLAAWTPEFSIRFDTRHTAWVAARSQIPSGWRWGSALVNHSTATGDDYAHLLFGSFFERLARMLGLRDTIHRAILQRANNHTCDDATEALDTLMFNVVGAFDAAAVAAHMGAGLLWGSRRSAGWQSKDWRKQLAVPHLYEMFHHRKPAADLFTVCRHLRNTVHGAGLTSMISLRPNTRRTLVRLPRAEADDLVERLNRLAPAETWGVDAHRGQVDIDQARLVEGLVPHIFTTLDEVLAHTPLAHLAGSKPYREHPPTDRSFDVNTRTRACLLYGLTPPTH